MTEHSPMFETYKEYYISGRFSKAALRKLVTAPKQSRRITAEEYEEISDAAYEPEEEESGDEE